VEPDGGASNVNEDEVPSVGQASPEPSQPKKKRRRRWPWVLLATLLLLVVGLRAALPTLVERGAAYGSRYWLGLPARIDNADFSLLDGTFVLEGVSVGADPDSVAPTDAALEPPAIDPNLALLHFDRVSAHLSWQDLREGRIRLTELALEAPSVRVLRESDGAIDPLRHARPLAPPSPPEAPAADEAPSEPWPVALDRFALSAPNLVIVDPASGENLLAFSLEKFALDKVSAKGSEFALGGVDVEGPVLRVRRDLVLAAPKPAGAPSTVSAPPEAVTLPPAGAVPAAAPAPSDAAAAAPAPAPAAAAPAAPAPGDSTPPAPAPAVTVPAAPAPAPIPPAPAGAAPVADQAESARASASGETAAAGASGEAAPAAGTAATDAASAAPPAAAPAPKSAAAPAAGYRIEKIDIARATFTWVTDKGPLDVALTLKASDITADEGKRFPLDLQLDIAKGHIGITGEVGILPPSYTGKLAWSGLPFPPLLLASLPDLAEWLRSADSMGDLTIDADIAGVNGPPSLRMSGRSSVDALAIADPGDKEFALGWKQLEVVMKNLLVPLPEPGKPARTTVADFELVKLVEPKIRYRHPSPALYALLGVPVPVPAPAPAPGKSAKPAAVAAKAAPPAAKKPTTNASKGAAKPDAKAVVAANAAKADAPPPPVDVSIANLELEAGDLEVTDTTVAPAVTTTVKSLFVTARAVHFPDPEASGVKIRAILPKASPLTIEGALRPGNNGDFTLSLQKLDLPVFSPYASAAGATLDAGQFSLTSKIKLRGTTTQVDNDLVLRKFGVSLRDPSSFDRSFGVPIDLALALLRDPSGDIKLRIPVKIGEKGAEISMGAVIASALKAALLGAVTAPLKMLGGAFEGAGSMVGGLAGGMFGIAPIGSAAGGAELAEDASSRADGLAKLLAQRPTMGLLLRGRTGAEDLPLVAEQILIERVKAGDGVPSVDGAGLLVRRRLSQFLEARDKALTKGKPQPEPLSADDKAVFDRCIAKVEVPPARLDALAKARADKLRDLLLAKGVNAERLTIGEREAEGSPGVLVSLRSR